MSGSGYQTEINYYESCIPQHNPQQIRFLLLLQGIRPPQITNACELGFGMGLSIGLHAAAQPECAWWGTDFNPSQVAFAQALTAALSPKPTLMDKSFEDLLISIEILPELDFICLHGIWSWVSEATRSSIVEIIARRLKPGGVLYMSYNCFPFWASIIPIRNLLMLHAERQGRKGDGVVKRFTDAVAFANALSKASPRFYERNPSATSWLEGLAGKDPAYLIGEYANASWTINHFHEVDAALAPARLSYAGYAYGLDIPDGTNLTPDQAAHLNSIGDSVLRETAKDLILNRTFRRDLWVKGITRLTAQERDAQLKEFKLAPIVPRQLFSMTLQGPVGELKMQESLFGPVADFLCSEDYRPKSLVEIAHAIETATKVTADMAWATTLEVCCILIGADYVAAISPNAGTSDAAQRNCDAINKFLIARAHSGEGKFLASPVATTPAQVNRLHQILIAAYAAGARDVDALAQYLSNTMAAKGEAFLRDGKPLLEPEEIRQELQNVTSHFLAEFLPLYRALRVIH